VYASSRVAAAVGIAYGFLRMPATTLYEHLSVPARGTRADRARTEYTADDRETVDRDRTLIDLYALLGERVAGDRSRPGRTEETKSTGETVDRDRAPEAVVSSLTGPPSDLYGALVEPARASGGDSGRTEITEATETLDWDRPPDLPHT
jgi:hypothetical protein